MVSVILDELRTPAALSVPRASYVSCFNIRGIRACVELRLWSCTD